MRPQMQSDVRKQADLPVDLVGRMVGAGYHWFEGVVSPSVPNAQHKYVLKRPREDEGTAGPSGTENVNYVINRKSLSVLESCKDIFFSCFASGEDSHPPQPISTLLTLFP